MKRLEIKYQKVSDLIPYENNPRHNEDAVKYVAASIKEFGFKVPIVVDKDNVIIAGHTRLLAAIDLGLDEVPTILADDLTEDQVKAYRLADNKVSDFSIWDNWKLLNELDNITLDLSPFGFAQSDLFGEELNEQDNNFLDELIDTTGKSTEEKLTINYKCSCPEEYYDILAFINENKSKYEK